MEEDKRDSSLVGADRNAYSASGHDEMYSVAADGYASPPGADVQEDDDNDDAMQLNSTNGFGDSHTVSKRDTADASDESEQFPHQLALNTDNLNTFSKSMQNGSIPLRVDTINDGAQEYRCNHPNASSSVNTNFKPASSAADFTSQPSNFCVPQLQPQSPMRAVGDAKSLSTYSLDGFQASNAAAGAFTDPLNTENLILHMRELVSGQPAPLQSENFSVALPKTAAPHRALSMNVEPSETAGSLYTNRKETASALDKHDVIEHYGVAEERWSVASTGVDRDFSILNEDNPQMGLSKESLLQLRRQLESGSTPLRPELLAGLGDVMRAFARPAASVSDKSASMAVEVPNEEATIKSPVGQRFEPVAAVPAALGARRSTSPATLHSAQREDGDGGGAAVRGGGIGDAECEHNDDDDDDDDVDDVDDRYGEDGDEDDDDGNVASGMFPKNDQDSRDGDHAESMYMTEDMDDNDDGVLEPTIKKRLLELCKLFNDNQQSQSRIAHQLKASQMAAEVRNMEVLAEIKAFQCEMLKRMSALLKEMRDQRRFGATSPPPTVAPLPPPPVATASAGVSSVLRLSVKYVRPNTATAAAKGARPGEDDAAAAAERREEEDWSFVLPISPHVTVGECKFKMMTRLVQLNVMDNAELAARARYFLLHNTEVLFDEDVLGEALGFSPDNGGNQNHPSNTSAAAGPHSVSHSRGSGSSASSFLLTLRKTASS